MRTENLLILGLAGAGAAWLLLGKRKPTSSKSSGIGSFWTGSGGCYELPLRSADLAEIRAETDRQWQLRPVGLGVEETIVHVASAALKELCPGLPVPSAPFQIAAHEAANGPGWTAAYQAARDSLGGRLVPIPE